MDKITFRGKLGGPTADSIRQTMAIALGEWIDEPVDMTRAIELYQLAAVNALISLQIIPNEWDAVEVLYNARVVTDLEKEEKN